MKEILWIDSAKIAHHEAIINLKIKDYNITEVDCDIRTARERLSKRYDLIVLNPWFYCTSPYIEGDDIPSLEAYRDDIYVGGKILYQDIRQSVNSTTPVVLLYRYHKSNERKPELKVLESEKPLTKLIETENISGKRLAEIIKEILDK